MFAELLKGAKEKAKAVLAWAVRTRNENREKHYRRVIEWIDRRLGSAASPAVA